MNRNDVLRMATEAGLGEFGHKDFCFYQPGVAGLERFVARIESAVRADEREECAKVCEEVEDQAWAQWKAAYKPIDQGRSIGADQCARAIRARGNNEPT